jgi:hypothetical protein
MEETQDSPDSATLLHSKRAQSDSNFEIRYVTLTVGCHGEPPLSESQCD